jgi:hypothetical protein
MKKIIALIILSVVLAACSQVNVKNEIIGKWHTNLRDSEYIIEFTKDGECIPYMNGEKAPQELHGKWELNNKGKITIDAGKSGVSTAYIDSNKNLILTPPEEARYKQIITLKKNEPITKRVTRPETRSADFWQVLLALA